MAPTVSARHADNGNGTLVSVAGCGVGGHQGYVRLDHGVVVPVRFDGDELSIEVPGLVATDVLVVVDAHAEVRAGVTPLDFGEPDVAGEDLAEEVTVATEVITVAHEAPAPPAPAKKAPAKKSTKKAPAKTKRAAKAGA